MVINNDMMDVAMKLYLPCIYLATGCFFVGIMCFIILMSDCFKARKYPDKVFSWETRMFFTVLGLMCLILCIVFALLGIMEFANAMSV